MSTSTSIPSLKLNDGNEIPLLGFGVGTALAKHEEDHVGQAVVTALKVGFTHFDGAQVYENEDGLGVGLKQSQVPRSSLFVTTKLHPRRSDPVAALDESLAKLGLEYVDLYLIHAPFVVAGGGSNGPAGAEGKKALQTVWAEMEQCKASGKAKSIGVSNFLQPHLEAVLETATVPPAINQMEYHPYLQHGDLLAWQKSQAGGIAMAAYSPLLSILKGSPGPVDAKHAELAKKYGVGAGDVALRWCMDQGIVTLTTSGKEERLKGFMESLPKFKLTDDEVKEISDLGRGKHVRGYWKNVFGEEDIR